MEMRAVEDIAIGEDLTPPLPPLAAVLHDGALTSRCSACFSTLPQQRIPHFAPTFPRNPNHAPAPFYCSPHCSSAVDSSAAELRLLSLFRRSPPSTWRSSSDLRLSLRLADLYGRKCGGGFGGIVDGLMTNREKLGFGEARIERFRGGGEGGNENSDENRMNCDEKYGGFERIAGLMTNREKLVFEESGIERFLGSDEGDNENSDENRVNCDDSGENTEDVFERIREGANLMAKARRMCRDEVEKQEDYVLDKMVLCLVLTNAVEVHDESGCSIGIAVYDTAFSWINHSCSPNACYRFVVGMECDEQNTPLRIAQSGCCDEYGRMGERNGYGPRVIVRSIKAVNKGEEVTIAYTDLLQPKEMRQAELWLKYRFNCRCKRCGALPATYVDYALQALSFTNSDCPDPSDNEIEKLTQSVDETITDYLSFDDPKSCCEKLENLLTHGHLTEPKEEKPPQRPTLQPFHHLSLNAYTTLASAYKVQADNLLSLNYDVERHKLEAFNMYKTSAAYSLLLAMATHHLFMYESSLIATAANFWINAGESLFNLGRSSLWVLLTKTDPAHQELSSSSAHKCSAGCLSDNLETNYFSPDQNMQLYINCIADIMPKVWRVLASKSGFLESIRNPIDFGGIGSTEPHFFKTVVKKGCCSSQLGDEECDDELRMNLIQLSVHCMRYGMLLSSACYGPCGLKLERKTLALLKEYG